MSNGERPSGTNRIILMIVPSFALVMAAWILGSQIKDTRLADRYVTVKGLVEREVKSDLAVWPVTFQETGDDLGAVSTLAQSDKETIQQFMTSQGFAPAEVQIGEIQVIDTQTDLNRANKPPHRFILRQTLTLTTNKVDAASGIAQKTLDLLRKGIVLVSENQYGQTQGVSYIFNGLNAIKPDMITEATRNARAAADRFAADSGSKVGTIRQAEQGVFSITATHGGNAGPENNFGPSDTSSLMKKVRVVTTVEYYLEK